MVRQKNLKIAHSEVIKRTSSESLTKETPSQQGKSKEIPISVEPKLRETQGSGLPYLPGLELYKLTQSRLNPPRTTMPL